ncbi:hypothetical protein [Pleionea sp. CnH1-48]|uniref:hypothetical protein n=1 Tax=Pleionea sp. CnH1-48 TaxID=2954494 RepID=UPI0020978F74|nr:hypothetical protein [Pleionea sp. CnH1-48]MCO7225495.1 hypothetical protein [Pleionea sp. CnH1-48]
MKQLKNMATGIILTATAALSISASATQYHPAKITHIASGGAYNGDVVIRLDGHDNANKPGCASGFWSLRFDGTTDEGKQAYAMALLAWSTNASLTVQGEGSCKSGTTTEQLRWIRGR